MLEHQLAKLNAPWLIVCGTVTLLIIGACALEEGMDRAKVAKTKAWPVCTGTIKLHETPAKDGTTLIRYDYSIGNRNYSSDRIYSDQGTSRVGGIDQNSFLVGQSVQVHYDPTAPDSAVLSTEPERGERKTNSYFKGMILGLCLLLAGLWRIRAFPYRAQTMRRV